MRLGALTGPSSCSNLHSRPEMGVPHLASSLGYLLKRESLGVEKEEKTQCNFFSGVWNRYATFEHRCDFSDRNGLEDGGAGRLRGTEPQDTSRQTTFDLPFQDCAWCQHCQCVFALCSPAISPAYLVRQGEKSTCTKDGAAAKLGPQSSSWVIALLIARLTLVHGSGTVTEFAARIMRMEPLAGRTNSGSLRPSAQARFLRTSRCRPTTISLRRPFSR